MREWLSLKAAASGAAALSLAWFTNLWPGSAPAPISPVRMLFTYPVTYLDPTLYDDWETVFIGNHIYPRLLPEEENPAAPSIAKDVALSCIDPAGPVVGPRCRRLQVAFAPKPFTDCAGRRYEIDDLRLEFERLLAAKSWAIPDWKRCKDGDSVCVTGMNTGDIARRLKNVNFRFGWSKRQKGDAVFGAGPYCLKAAPGASGSIQAGVLDPHQGGTTLPKIDFAVGGGADAEFNLALYGSKELLRSRRKNVQAHTPLAYYAVTHPSLADRRMSWNTERTRTLIHKHFVGRGVFFPGSPEIERLVPAGSALDSKEPKGSGPASAEFAIPDYLPGCQDLAATLTAAWSGDGGAKARCVDIVTYIQGKVREKRGGWSGFLVGLSPGDAGRDAIKLQYFSKESTDSLTYDYRNPDVLYYLAGIGQSLVTVDGQRVCDLKPNALGLGNIFITDLVGCDR